MNVAGRNCWARRSFSCDGKVAKYYVVVLSNHITAYYT